MLPLSLKLRNSTYINIILSDKSSFCGSQTFIASVIYDLESKIGSTSQESKNYRCCFKGMLT